MRVQPLKPLNMNIPQLSVGMKVKVNHPRLAGKDLIVNNINGLRTKATLSLNGGACYTVPISLIEY
jgi:hypothetical protein